MKKIIISITLVIVTIVMGSCSTKVSSTRDLAYEAYCDSIWEADPEWYLDVLVEMDEYQDYIARNGVWFE